MAEQITMLICLQCAMKAMLENREPPSFNQTEAEHIREYHPDPEKTKQERAELDKRMAELDRQLKERHKK